MRHLLVLVLLVPLAAGQTVPEGIHVTLASSDAEAAAAPPDATLLAVTWHVPDGYLPTDAPQVRYRIGNGSEQAAAASQVGQTVETFRPGSGAGVDMDGTDLLYAATLSVPPGEQVTYRVGEPSKGWSGEFAVRQLPGSNQSLRVAVVADIGGFTLDGDDQQVQMAIRDLIVAQEPDIVVIPGDLAYSTSDASWGAWMRMMEPLFATVPVAAVPGNHEWQTSVEGYDQFKARFVLPVQIPTEVRPDEVSAFPVTNRGLAEEFYAFAAGPVYFIGLNSDRICTKNSPQATSEPPCTAGAPEPVQFQWLRETIEDISEDARPAWLVPFFHHPAYSHGNHPGEPAVQALWVPLFDTYSADLVLTAHDHNYQRSWPLRAGVERQVGGAEFVKGDGTVYVVTGGGGRSLYEMAPDPQPPWLAASNVTYHITLVDASPGRLDVRAVALGNETIDAFSIVAGEADGPGPSTAKSNRSPVGWLPLVACAVLGSVARRR